MFYGSTAIINVLLFQGGDRRQSLTSKFDPRAKRAKCWAHVEVGDPTLNEH